MRDPTTSFCIRVLGGQSVEMLIAKHQYVADSYCHLPAEKILSYLGKHFIHFPVCSYTYYDAQNLRELIKK